MVFLQFEVILPQFLRLLAQIYMLDVTDEVRRELRTSQLSTHPLPGGLSFFLKCVFHHQMHRLLTSDSVGVHSLIQNGNGGVELSAKK